MEREEKYLEKGWGYIAKKMRRLNMLLTEDFEREKEEREKYRKALELALYYVNSDSTWESLKYQIRQMGIEVSDQGKVK